ncbi:hypothetical protein CMI45_02340 [Candidatus Pacearchaeota archaeon]|jgi:hypothetical protein|nr:hypothetical protein [Candidatus Pacearchaeota archaeon]|tara:strand:+ start:3589 stop:4704 length:1116 start_codon:yes stop_codon:yes gene_type:complete
MNRILSLSVMALLVFSVIAIVPLVIAEGADVDGGVDVGVDSDDEPVVCQDSTQRSWYPNDQTIKTAEIYASGPTPDTNDYGASFYDVPARGSYVFAGETITYYVYAAHESGKENIEDVTLTKDGVGVGNCAVINDTVDPATDLDEFSCNPADLDDLDSNDGDIYACVLVVQGGWSGSAEISVEVVDEDGNVGQLGSSDLLTMNPDLSVTLTGSVSFGTVEEGDTVTSNSVFLNNVGSEGVVMDMYIGSDDYFTDPSGGTAVCANDNGVTTNGIHFGQFSYYATKGSVDSGDNDGVFFGLGTIDCIANSDEYTNLTSYSGDLDDDCRIINHLEEGSLLTQGQSMSLTFQLDVPDTCEGSFTDGKFHFTGRVV